MGHHEATITEETNDSCSAYEPAVHLRIRRQECDKEEIPLEELAMYEAETGGEDTPDAYRLIPADPMEANMDIV